MKIQNWDRWHQEKDAVSDAVDGFSQVCQDPDGSRNYAYEAGWWSTTVKRLLMEVPRAYREQELQLIQDQIRTLEARKIMSVLTNKS